MGTTPPTSNQARAAGGFFLPQNGTVTQPGLASVEP
jgi:hypothetical protein